MTVHSLAAGAVSDRGESMHALVRELYPVCRSITGDGVRATLRRLRNEVPLEIHEVASGTGVLDWEVPDEWNVRDAWIAGPDGHRVVDFRAHSLHVVSYSTPVRATMTARELASRLHSLPAHPTWIPYRTAYYARDWGFCVTEEQRRVLMEGGPWEVVIDSTLAPGSLTYGEVVVPGATDETVLVSAHCCHPSLANDNLAGIAVAVELARWVAEQPRRCTYRFAFVPATIGAITWLARNREVVPRVRHGLVLACAGDGGALTYKRSRQGVTDVDRAAAHVLGQVGGGATVRDFVPYGYDERQYCSPGPNLPMGTLMRTPNGEYPEYHTSADDPDLVRAWALQDTLEACVRIVQVLEDDATFVNQAPWGEPQLGRRGLYGGIGTSGLRELPGFDLALLWVLNQSDGRHSLLDIAERSGLDFDLIRRAAAALEGAGLLKPNRAEPVRPALSA